MNNRQLINNSIIFVNLVGIKYNEPKDRFIGTIYKRIGFISVSSSRFYVRATPEYKDPLDSMAFISCDECNIYVHKNYIRVYDRGIKLG